MENKNVVVTLPVPDWNIILAALGTRPYADVAAIIEAIKMQAAQQISPPSPVGVTQEEV